MARGEPRAASADAVRRLVERFVLAPGAAEKLVRLARLLSEDPHAPTSIRDPERVLRDHLADSLVALELAEVREARTVADLGAGAGLPGIPLAIALPEAAFSLVESAAPRCRFLERTLHVCGVENAEVVHARAEAWPEGIGRFELVTARALAALEVVTEYAAPLLRVGGTLVAWRGRRDEAEEAAGAIAAERLGMAAKRVVTVSPYPEARHRHLHVLRKVMETPAGFPRRPGVAAKRPLSR